MGDLGADTAVEQVGERRWRATLSDDWEIWGPNGGYVAAVCLRAAGAASGLARPATLACHFLAVAEFGEVDLDVEVLRGTRRTAAVRVHVHQGGRPIAEATSWAVADGIDGYAWTDRTPPDVAPWPDTPTIQERLTPEELEQGPPFRFWRNFDERPCEWIPREDFESWPGGPHRARTWMRFVPTPRFDDPWVEACRATILLDTWCWPAATRGLAAADRNRFVAPSLDVTIRFHDLAAATEWLLVDAAAPYAGDGLVGAESAVWSDHGRLVASAGSQLLCRPVPA